MSGNDISIDMKMSNHKKAVLDTVLLGEMGGACEGDGWGLWRRWAGLVVGTESAGHGGRGTAQPLEVRWQNIPPGSSQNAAGSLHGTQFPRHCQQSATGTAGCQGKLWSSSP